MQDRLICLTLCDKTNIKIVEKANIILVAIMMLVLNSCSDPTTFTVKGNIEGEGTQNMRAVYYDDGGINLLIVPVDNGKFEFEANLNAPTLIEFFSANKILMGRAYVEPGDDIKCNLYNNAPYKAQIKGNDVSERWSKFLNDNIEITASENSDKINSLIVDYINKNNADVLSTILLITEYHTPENNEEASKLLLAIAPEARPHDLIESYEALLDRSFNIKASEKLTMISHYSSTDSLKTFVPNESSYTIITFSNKDTRNDGELADSLRMLRKSYHGKRLQVIDMSLDEDTTIWKKSVKNDSATWRQGWIVGTVSSPSIERLGVSRLPFYIVADSTGKQIYRGGSIENAISMVNERLKTHRKQL